ncbi:MAG TPA: hypothetical protein VJN44_16685 [Roseateles sp.]|nr:hypothetical protein [Roseateles sp.]
MRLQVLIVRHLVATGPVLDQGGSWVSAASLRARVDLPPPVFPNTATFLICPFPEFRGSRQAARSGVTRGCA